MPPALPDLDEDTAFGRDAEDFEVIVQGLVHRRHR